MRKLQIVRKFCDTEDTLRCLFVRDLFVNGRRDEQDLKVCILKQRTVFFVCLLLDDDAFDRNTGIPCFGEELVTLKKEALCSVSVFLFVQLCRIRDAGIGA